MDLCDLGYVIVMALWSALVVLLSYQLGYDNGRWQSVVDAEGAAQERLKAETLKTEIEIVKRGR